MANKKINELNNLTSAENSDLLIIDDISTSETKNITVGNLLNGLGPSGSNQQLQFKNGSSFGGVPNATWNGSTLFVTGAFKGNIDGNASSATTASYANSSLTASYALSAASAISLATNTLIFSLNGTANGVATNIGGVYIPASMTISTGSLAYIGGSTASETAILKLVPINSITPSATWTRANVLGSVALSSSASLGAGWYDVILDVGNGTQTGFARGLYITT